MRGCRSGSTVNGSASLSSAAGSWCVFSVITSYFFLTLAARKPPYGVCAVRLWRELCCILLHTHVLLVWQSSHGEKRRSPHRSQRLRASTFQLCSELFAIEAIDSLGVGSRSSSVGSRSSSFRSGGGLRSIFRHLNGDDGLFRVLNVELNAFRQNNVLSEHLGAVG